MLRSQTEDQELAKELLWICELIYHMNPTLRTSFTVTREEIERLAFIVDRLQAQSGIRGFVLPCGCQSACTAHLLRVKAKGLVRLLYRYAHRGGEVPDSLLIFAICSPVISFCLRLNSMCKTGWRSAAITVETTRKTRSEKFLNK